MLHELGEDKTVLMHGGFPVESAPELRNAVEIGTSPETAIRTIQSMT
jgi:hypothetical protein